ncbi:MAG TPA: histidine phosphatase family protein [Actinomycetota bacterium]|nr:histidine phosphatase family protein [Actinomycetota bacterium]
MGDEGMTTPDAPKVEGTVHLVRHGHVENPGNVIYGRLPGFVLSATGRDQAAAAAERLSERPLDEVWSSPLERAQETAATIATPHGLEVVTDERLVESGTTLEGVGRRAVAFATSPQKWWSLRNPLRPSWGESFVEISARMTEVIFEVLEASPGAEVAFVSHQTPVLVARLALARRRVPPWLAFTPCETGSITTLGLIDGEIVRASYFVPPKS